MSRYGGLQHSEWLALAENEDPLDADLPICDPHHHLWVRGPTAGKSFRNTSFLVPDLVAEYGGHNIQKTVFVEANSCWSPTGPIEFAPVAETAFANGCAEMSVAFRNTGQHPKGMEVASGIIAFADLTLGADKVDAVLKAHKQASPRLRGIRHAFMFDKHNGKSHIAHQADPTNYGVARGRPAAFEGQLGSARFREGFKVLQKHSLTFDAWGSWRQLGELSELAKSFPDTKIISCHAGGLHEEDADANADADENADVNGTSGNWLKWQVAVSELAKSPNVYMKLGGLTMWGFGVGSRLQHMGRPPTSRQLANMTGDVRS